MNRYATAALAALFGIASLSAQSEPTDTFELDPLIANANRLQPTSVVAAPPTANFDLDTLASARFGDVSDALNAYPGFSAFRRSHAIAAHPTTQGVRLRNVGANATSRALVLFDGVPQNDPFGAWVYWHQFDLAQIESLAIHPGGSGELWGNFGSGGAISFASEAARPDASELRLSLGSSDWIDLQANTSRALASDTTLDIGLRHFESDGFHTLREDQRGPIDQPARSEADLLNARLRFQPSEAWQGQVALRYFDESRSNGTPQAVNDTQGFNLSMIAERAFDQQSRLNLTLYYQDRDFYNVFTSVADDRASERPALEQYDVPAQSLGGAVVYRRDSSNGLSFNAGLDFRAVDGSVNERYRNLGSGFTRNRRAGGEQRFLGAFATLAQAIGDQDRLSASLRVDEVAQRDGLRVETNTENGQTLLDETYPKRNDNVLSGNLHWRRELDQDQSLFATAFSGFRAPTLNELYRPYRVRNDITEANPNLVNERQQGIELGYLREDDAENRFRLSAFHYELDETIANALLTTEAGFDPRFGFIPEGGSGSQRVNLDQSRVSGFEVRGETNLLPSLRAAGSLVYAETEVQSDELSQFAGRSFPQSSPFQATLSLDWQATGDTVFWSRYHWTDRSWESLGNDARLGAAADLTLGLRREFGEAQSLSLVVTNALDEIRVTGVASNGLVSIGAPREFRLVYTWRQ